MYKNSYQKGKSLEILTTQTLDKWKTTGTVKQIYDKTALGYVFNVEAQGKGCLQFPNTDKSSLGIVMPFIVLQVYLPSSKPFQIDFKISDGNGTKRHLIFAHGTKSVVRNQLHSRVPSALFKRNIWLNLCISVREFFEY